MFSLQEVVNAFIAAANRNDLEGMCALAHEQIEYINDPMPEPNVGVDAMRKVGRLME